MLLQVLSGGVEIRGRESPAILSKKMEIFKRKKKDEIRETRVWG